MCLRCEMLDPDEYKPDVYDGELTVEDEALIREFTYQDGPTVWDLAIEEYNKTHPVDSDSNPPF